MTNIQRHMLMMFIALRWGVGIAGISLPIILAGVGRWVYGIPLAGSMSAYYYATGVPSDCMAMGAGPMRNWFVGTLFFIGGAMLLMRGFSRVENWVLDVAGIMAPCVALFPMTWGNKPGFNPHPIFAIAFFVCIGFTCVFCSEKTLSEMPSTVPDRAKVIAFYRRWYRVLGILMVVAPVCAHLFLWREPHRQFVVETAGVGAFGAYWLFKTFELKRSDVEQKALMGQLPAMNLRTWR